MLLTETDQIRTRFRFDAERLRSLALRIEAVDDELHVLRRSLEDRAAVWAESHGLEREHVLSSAKAHAVASLAKRAVLAELHSKGAPMALIAAMALSRWVSALRNFGGQPRGPSAVRMHIETGRVAYRIQASLRRRRVRGAGRLASAIVVGEVVHPADLAVIHTEIERSLKRAADAGVAEEVLFVATAKALRDGARLLERVLSEAEPAVAKLRRDAEAVETRVERELTRQAR